MEITEVECGVCRRLGWSDRMPEVKPYGRLCHVCEPLFAPRVLAVA